MKQLNMKGKPTRLSLTTLGKANSKTESSIVSLELTDLQGENNITRSTIGLHILFSSNLDKSYQFQQNLQEFFKSLEKFDQNRKNLHKNFCRVAQY